jgi:HlyD family secretion protein
MIKKKLNDDNEYSEEIEKILNSVPTWILKRGLLVLSSIVFSLLLFSILIKYPIIRKETVIIKEDKGFFYGEIQIPEDVTLRLKTGQRVLVKLNGYPSVRHTEFEGVIRSIELKDSVWIARVDFEKFKNRDINLKNMSKGAIEGKADVIVDEKTILNLVQKKVLRIF